MDDIALNCHGKTKDTSYVLAEPLTNIINKALRQSVVPDNLKIAKMIPLFKSGSLNSIDNYRPISVLPTVSKLMERVVYNQLSEYLEQKGLLSESQYGFQKRL